MTDGLQGGNRPPVCRDRFLLSVPCFEQTSRLPLPAVQRFRGINLLGGEGRPAGELQGVLIPAFVFVEGTEIPPGVRGRALVVDGLSDPRGLIQHVEGTLRKGTVGVGEVRTKRAIGQPIVINP